MTTFGNELAEHLFDDRDTPEVRALPYALRRTVRRKLALVLEAHDLKDLQTPPASRLKSLGVERNGTKALLIDERWRITFRWVRDRAFDIAVEDVP